MKKIMHLCLGIVLVFSAVFLVKAECFADGGVVITDLVQEGADYVYIQWEDSDTTDGYVLYREDNGGDRKLIKTVIGNSCYNYGLSNGGVYAYSVRPFTLDSDGNRVYGDSSDTRTIQIGLNAPEILEISRYANGAVRIAWKSDPLAEGHLLYRSEDGSSWSLIKRVPGNETVTYGLQDGVTYYFRLRSSRTVDGTDRYSQYSIMRSVCLGLPAPEGLTATQAGATYCKLSWDAVDGAEAYRVYRSLNGEAYSLVKTVTGTVTYNYNLDAQSTYRYKVAAIRTEDGRVIRSADSESVELLMRLGAPDEVLASYRFADGATVRWSPVDGVTGYRFYRENEAGDVVLVKTISDSETNTFSLDRGQTYRFGVRPVNTEGEYTVNGEISWSDIYYHSLPPTAKILGCSETHLLLSWNEVEGAEGYVVYHTAGEAMEKILETEKCQAALDLPAEDQYCVTAVRKSAETAASELVLWDGLLEEEYSFSHCAIADYRSANLTWAPVEKAAAYELERQTADGEWITLAQQEDTGYLDRTLESGESYTYRFRPIFEEGEERFAGGWSSCLRLTMPEAPVYRAVLIGEESYTETLNGPGNDIERMKELLRGMSEMEWIVYSQKDATKNEISSLVSLTLSEAGPNDVSLFYYSGHGITNSTQYYSGALLTVDYEYIPTQELAAMLSAVPGRVIVLLDSCGSGAAISDGTMSMLLDQAAQQAEMPEELEPFSPEQFNSGVVEAFSAAGTGLQTRSGELKTDKFYVITSSAYEQNSRSINQNGIWGGGFTRGITASAGMDFNTNTWIDTMPGDTDGDEILTIAECYGYCRDYTSAYQDILSYPQGSAFPFLYK